MTWKRAGLPSCTRQMLAVLSFLRDAKREEWPLVHVDGVDPRTLRALVRRDWIVDSDGYDGTRYGITQRGLNALSIYEKPSRYRFDGLCTDCGEKPKHVGRTGHQYVRCLTCQRKYASRQWRFKGRQLDPDGLCARCRKRKRHVQQPSGQPIAYCLKCRRKISKIERKRKYKRKLAAIRRGEIITCCKCDQPVYHTDRIVYDYCYQHYFEYQRKYRARRKAETEGW